MNLITRPLAASAAACVLATAGQAQTQFTFVDIGNLGVGGSVVPEALNNAGTAVGRAPFGSGQRPFVWTTGQGMQIVPGVDQFASATAINDDGVIAGTLGVSLSIQGFRVDGGVLETLGFLPGDSASEVTGLTASGAAIGNSGSTGGLGSVSPGSTFVDATGTPQLLLAGALSFGVSPSGLYTGALNGRAFVFDGAQVVDLGIPGNPGEFDAASGADVNDEGIVAGEGRQFGGFSSPGSEQAYVWIGGVPTRLPVPDSSAVAVNAHGVVVGNSDQGPFQYDTRTGSLVFLESITSGVGGRELVDVVDINDHGQILGTFRQGFQSTRGAFLLNPVPLGVAFCSTNPNSTGASASISAVGSESAGDDQVVLRTVDVPNTPGLFFFGTDRAFAPLGDGNLCVGGTITRLSPVVTGRGNAASLRFDVQGQGVTAGQVLAYQYWYRDVLPGGAGSNLSNAVELTFVP